MGHRSFTTCIDSSPIKGECCIQEYEPLPPPFHHHGLVYYYFLKHAHENIRDNIDCIALKLTKECVLHGES